MKKIVLASAISALFAAPVAAFAQAKPAIPTLGQIFEASGITESGYIDAGYSALKNGAGFTTRVFDGQQNSFALNQVGLTLAKQPKEGFGGLVNVTVGRDAQFIHSFPENQVPTSSFDITQAYAQWAGGPLTVIAGKFTTLHGTEVIASTGNVNISRSILFGAVPFTHTGVRATWALSDTFSLIGGLNNGWDQLTDQNKGKTLELGATLTPIKPLTMTLSAYSGKESGTPSSNTTNSVLAQAEGTRTSVDFVASWQVTDPLSIGIEYLTLSQDNFASLAAGGGTIKAKYSGFAGYVTYMFTPKFRGTLRAESFDDKDGLHFGQPLAPGQTGAGAQKFKEATLTVAYLPSDSFELRAELRQDSADQKAFNDGQGNASKSMSSAALSGIYKF